MASVKIELRKKTNAQGLRPLAIRITKNRQPRYLHVGYSIAESQWDKLQQKVRKSHPNAARLNNFLLKKLAETNDTVLGLETENPNITVQQIMQVLNPQSDEERTFQTLANEYQQELEAKGKFSQVSANKSRIQHLINYHKGKPIAFEAITVPMLKGFHAYLKVQRKVSERTVMNNMVLIRTIFNRAISEGVIEQTKYPFGRGKFQIKFPETQKIGLTNQQVTSLENIELPARKEHHARNVWLFSYYFAGMRISDVLRLRWRDTIDGRLYYQMGKNQKTLSLKFPAKAKAILEEYRTVGQNGDDYIFPELHGVGEGEKAVHRKIVYGNKNLNKFLQRVADKLGFDRPLTMHIARHTFATASGDLIPVQTLQKLYRHSSITTTINYQKAFMLKEADEALEKVLGA